MLRQKLETETIYLNMEKRFNVLDILFFLYFLKITIDIHSNVCYSELKQKYANVFVNFITNKRRRKCHQQSKILQRN